MLVVVSLLMLMLEQAFSFAVLVAVAAVGGGVSVHGAGVVVDGVGVGVGVKLSTLSSKVALRSCSLMLALFMEQHVSFSAIELWLADCRPFLLSSMIDLFV